MFLAQTYPTVVFNGESGSPLSPFALLAGCALAGLIIGFMWHFIIFNATGTKWFSYFSR